MSKVDIINDEIARRTNVSNQLKLAENDLLKTKEQFFKLDEMYRQDEKVARDKLECIYKEYRHFTGKSTRVYSFADTEYYPLFNGSTDSECNPYFPISKVKDKTFDGMGPLYVGPTGGFGSWNRDVVHPGPTEPALRTASMNALSAFPNTASEVASCSNPAFTTQLTCTTGGGTWGYAPGVTATELLRTPLTAWRDKIQNQLMVDICNEPSQVSFWQNIVNKINIILSAITTNVSYPNNTPDFAPGSPADLARDYLLAYDINTPVTNRINYLSTEANKQEQIFFSVIKLRLHQANGSFAKKKTIDYQIQTNKSILKDNNDAIASLNILKVKNS